MQAAGATHKEKPALEQSQGVSGSVLAVSANISSSSSSSRFHNAAASAYAGVMMHGAVSCQHEQTRIQSQPGNACCASFTHAVWCIVICPFCTDSAAHISSDSSAVRLYFVAFGQLWCSKQRSGSWLYGINRNWSIPDARFKILRTLPFYIHTRVLISCRANGGYTHMQTDSDPHPPGPFRTNGAVRMLPL